MKFEVNFSTDTDNPLASSKCLCEGLSDLDLAREITKNPNLHQHQIDYSCYYKTSMIDIELTEDQARSILIFKDRCEINIECPEKAFNKYLYRDIIIDYKYEKFMWWKIKTINGVKIRYRINEQQVIEDWVNHGCPLRWNPSDPNGEFPEPVTNDEESI